MIVVFSGGPWGKTRPPKRKTEKQQKYWNCVSYLFGQARERTLPAFPPSPTIIYVEPQLQSNIPHWPLCDAPSVPSFLISLPCQTPIQTIQKIMISFTVWGRNKIVIRRPPHRQSVRHKPKQRTQTNVWHTMFFATKVTEKNNLHNPPHNSAQPCTTLAQPHLHNPSG